MDSMVPVCPVLSMRSGIEQLCLGDQCAFYITPVRKCAIYVLGHKNAVDLQHLQQEMKASQPPPNEDRYSH